MIGGFLNIWQHTETGGLKKFIIRKMCILVFFIDRTNRLCRNALFNIDIDINPNQSPPLEVFNSLKGLFYIQSMLTALPSQYSYIFWLSWQILYQYLHSIKSQSIPIQSRSHYHRSSDGNVLLYYFGELRHFSWKIERW